jgi:2-dehydropantoate 2-reductase
MKLAIVGPGSMGCLFAAHLAEGGHDVVLIDYRPERAEMISRQGIIIDDGGAERVVRVRASAAPEAARDAEGVMFMVKAYSTASASDRLSKHIAPGAWVMSLQNGMGNAEILAETFGEDRALAGATSQAANQKGQGVIHHAGRGETFVGELSGVETDRAKAVASALAGSGIPAAVTNNVAGLLWKKLIVNVGINPITALLRIRNGQILERPSARALMRSAVYEAETVSRVSRVRLDVPNACELAETVARDTGDNISSMYQDVAAGRRTEIDFMCGFVVREGMRLDVPAPVNATLLRLVRSLTETACTPGGDFDLN